MFKSNKKRQDMLWYAGLEVNRTVFSSATHSLCKLKFSHKHLDFHSNEHKSAAAVPTGQPDILPHRVRTNPSLWVLAFRAQWTIQCPGSALHHLHCTAHPHLSWAPLGTALGPALRWTPCHAPAQLSAAPLLSPGSKAPSPSYHRLPLPWGHPTCAGWPLL